MTEAKPGRPTVSRRTLVASGLFGLGGAALLAGGLRDHYNKDPSAPPGIPDRHLSSAGPTYGTREAYDVAAAVYRRHRGERPGDLISPGGDLAWGESRALGSYVTMYQATGDIGYLDNLVEASQPILAARDDQRGQVDYRGLSHPGWGAGAPYTVAQLDLLDLSGTPALRLVSALSDDKVLVDIRSEVNGLFGLTVRGSSGVVETVVGLSLAQNHPRYVIRVLRSQYPGPALLTASTLRARLQEDRVLIDTTGVLMPAQRYLFAVHTGMICAPWARFAALVNNETSLARRYADSAVELLSAAEAAVQLHEDDYRSITEDTGIYSYPIGAPVRADGTYLPHNQYLVMARCFTLLYGATRNPVYRRRASSMLNLFLSDLSPDSSPRWSYYWTASQPFQGFGLEAGSVHSPRMAPNRRAEDPSHGALDVDALVAGLNAGLNVPNSLMMKLVGTFFDYVVRQGQDGRWVTARDFKSSKYLPDNDLGAALWVALARWDRRVYNTVVALLSQVDPPPRHGQVLSIMAELVALR